MLKSFTALLLLTCVCSAEPFTGRYLLETTEDEGVSMTGYIDFVAAPMGTTSFSLASGFVSGFSFTGSGPGVGSDSINSLADLFQNDVLTFSAALGASELVVVAPATSGLPGWYGRVNGGLLILNAVGSNFEKAMAAG